MNTKQATERVRPLLTSLGGSLKRNQDLLVLVAGVYAIGVLASHLKKSPTIVVSN